jgi:energy-converting hydrogenase Eha subunit E
MKSTKQRIDWSVQSLTESSNMESSKSITTAIQAEELKSALVKRLSAEYADVGARMVFQAVNEAHALASLTFVPLLVLPSLAEEKVQKAAAWSAHQRVLLGDDHFAFAA